MKFLKDNIKGLPGIINKAIQGAANTALQSLVLQLPIDKYATVNFDFTQDPTVNGAVDEMSFYLKGEVVSARL